MRDVTRHETTPTRKREREESFPNATDLPCKKRKQRYASGYPPEFWDTLSIVRLTRRALREFDQRTCQRGNRRDEGFKARRTSGLLRSDYRRLRDLADKGGPNIDHLRGYAEAIDAPAAMSQSSSQSRKRSAASSSSRGKSTRQTKNTSTYDGEFEQKMIDCGIYPEGYRIIGTERAPRPENMEELRAMLAQTRASLSPSQLSESGFEDFKELNRLAKSEASAMAQVIPKIAGTKDVRHRPAADVLFNNLNKFDDTVVTAKPDISYGARLEQIDPRVRKALDSYIIPSTRKDLLVAPNYFLEGKSASGRADVAQRQVTDDGAYGGQGLLELQNYGQPRRAPDGNAYTLSATYLDGQMKMYAHHPRQSELRPGRMDYHTTQVRAYAMTDTVDSFRQGAAAYRNARDWTQEQRDRIISEANARAQSRSMATPSSSRGARISAYSSNTSRHPSSASDTSADELAAPSSTIKRPRQGSRR